MPQPSVIVVGGGAMGSSIAAELARRGHPVTVLEQHGMLHARGSSHGTSRIVRVVYDDPFYVRLAMTALQSWHELQEQQDVEVFRRTGGVDHGPRELLEPFAAALDEAGATYEWLTADEAGRRWPGLRFDEAVLFQPDGGVAHPDNILAILQGEAVDSGAEWHPHTRVDTITETSRGVRVVAGDRTFSADQVVVAAGVWSHRLVDLPADLAIQVQPAHFAPRDLATPWPTFIHRRTDEHGTAIPEAYGLPSPDGIKIGFHGGGKVVDPDDRDFTVVETELEELMAYVAEWVPGVDPSTLDAGTCLYGALAEEDFIIDRSGSLTVAAGFSGHGFKFVPLVGRMVADLVAGSAQPEPRFTVSAHSTTT